MFNQTIDVSWSLFRFHRPQHIGIAFTQIVINKAARLQLEVSYHKAREWVPVNETQENHEPCPVGVKEFEQRIVWGGTLLFAHGVPSPVV